MEDPETQHSDLDKVRAHFLRKAKRGVILSAEELLEYASDKSLDCQDLERLRKLKEDWKFTAMYQKVSTPKAFAQTTHYRYGVCHVDMGFMSRQLKEANRGNWGFVVCVEVASLQVAVEPVADKSRDSWNRALNGIVQTSSINKITTLMSDEERALTSAQTVERLKRDYGIRMVFLKHRNKAYYAELFIAIIKRMLGMSMRYARKRKDPQAGNWTRFLGPIVKHLNGRRVPGTNFARSSVNEFNFMQMLEEKTGGQAYSQLNLGRVAGSRLERYGRRLFKFKVKDRVLLDRKVLPALRGKKTFTKPSAEGGFGPKVFVVSRRQLRASGPDRYVPLYKVREAHSRTEEKIWLYQSDLRRLSSKQQELESESEEEAEQEEARRK